MLLLFSCVFRETSTNHCCLHYSEHLCNADLRTHAKTSAKIYLPKSGDKQFTRSCFNNVHDNS